MTAFRHLLLMVALSLPAAAKMQIMLSGKLQSWDVVHRIVTIRQSKGQLTRVHLVAGARLKIGDTSVVAARFQPGMEVAVRIFGLMDETPLRADLICDVGSSARYRGTPVGGPGDTRIGDFPSTGGTATNPQIPSTSPPDHVLGVLGNDGHPTVADPIELKARVLQVGRDTGTLTVLATNGASPQTVLLGSGPPTTVEVGQMVLIRGHSNAAGVIEASSVTLIRP